MNRTLTERITELDKHKTLSIQFKNHYATIAKHESNE